jgi:4-diphosphocytidyl-2-C-methyl-D-erythritol kinase
MLAFPNCKINLGLNITGKRPDGFHNIESIFYPVNLCDILEIIPDPAKGSRGVDFTSSGISIPGNDSSNLCVRAYELLNKHFKLPAVRMHLHKIIPIGSGLGGGSADGAFTLKLLNNMFGLQQTEQQLEHFAALLGSDCPFFIKNKPAYVHGRGEFTEPVDLELENLQLIIVYPGINISTTQAFSKVVPGGVATVNLKNIIKKPVSQWKGKMINDFEAPLFDPFPGLEKIKDLLYENGAIYASMSGSGSALYGLFDESFKLKNQFEGYSVYQVKV